MTFDFDFGKYAPYLWASIVLMILVLGALSADTLMRARKWRKKAEALQAEKQSRTGQP